MKIELYIERMEQYETGTMTAAERAVFESELATNAALRQALALFQQTNEVIEQGIENSLRSQLRTWKEEVVVETPMTVTKSSGGRVVRMRSTWVRLAVAASIALLVGWFGVRWAHSQYADEALFAAQYEKPTDSSFRSGSAADRPLQPGLDAWSAGDLNKAMLFFSNISPDDDHYAEAEYYLGHVALQQQQYDLAIAAFGLSAQHGPSKFKEKAEWNRVLAYLAAGHTQYPEFQAFLGQIADNPAHSYQAQAGVLQGKLTSVWR